MGQKVNPHGLRVGVIKDWDSRWYARNEKVGDLVVEDYNLRKYLRISPRKVKIVADLIRGKSLEQATAILLTTPKAASEPLLKLLKSAAANAENNHKMDPENLYVSEVFATPGPIIKRIMPRAQGRAYRINKRTSHVTIAVSER